MIDTASVGLLSGTAQQAALNPAASVTDCGALVVAFMYTATTNLIAAAVGEDIMDDDEAEDGSAVAVAVANAATIHGKTEIQRRRRGCGCSVGDRGESVCGVDFLCTLVDDEDSDDYHDDDE